jgi:hypothetical protein
MNIQEALDGVVSAVENFNSMLVRYEPESAVDFLLTEASYIHSLSADTSPTESNQSVYLWDKVSHSLKYIMSVLQKALPAFSTAAASNSSHYHFVNADKRDEFDESLQFLDANSKLVTKQYDLALRRLSRIPDSVDKKVLEESLKDTYTYLITAYSVINKGIDTINKLNPCVHFNKISTPL